MKKKQGVSTLGKSFCMIYYTYIPRYISYTMGRNLGTKYMYYDWRSLRENVDAEITVVFFTPPRGLQYFSEWLPTQLWKYTKRHTGKQAEVKDKTPFGIWTRDIFPQTRQHLTFLKNVWIIYIISRCVVYIRASGKNFLVQYI